MAWRPALVAWSLAAPRLPSRWHPVPHAVARRGAGRAHPRPARTAAARVVVGCAVRPCRRRAGGARRRGGHGVAAGARRRWPSATCPTRRLRWLLLRYPARHRLVGGGRLPRRAGHRRRGRVRADGRPAAAGGGVRVVTHRRRAQHRRTRRATVLVTGLAGWVFGWLYERSGSLIAPMLAHLAVNEAGAVAALAVQRIGSVAADERSTG